jgi:hypothetical protein
VSDEPTKLNPNPSYPVDAIKAFFDEFRADTSENFFYDRERVWHSTVGIELCPRWGKVHISAIRTFPSDDAMGQTGTRGQGNASQALDWLCGLADKHQVTLDGFAKPFGGADPGDKKTRFNKRQLMSWYKRHGFIVSSNGDLVREPKGAAKEEPLVLKLKGPMKVIPIEKNSTVTVWTPTKIVRWLTRECCKEWGCTSRQINNGMCDEFAYKLQPYLPGSLVFECSLDNDSDWPTHFWVKYEGKCYDSQCPEGVDDWKDLPLYRKCNRETAPKDGELLWFDASQTSTE